MKSIFSFLLLIVISNKAIASLEGETLICDKDTRGYNFISKDIVKVSGINLNKLKIFSINHSYEINENAIFIQQPLTVLDKEETPRPIGWISTRGKDGIDNLAPYSFFNAVAYTPPQVMFSATSSKADQGDTKDTVANIRQTGVFCVNIVSEQQITLMNKSSQALPKGIDEFEFASIEKKECTVINCPLVAGGPAALECKLTEIIHLSGESNFAVFGEVVGIHMRDDCIVNGRFDLKTYNPVSRLGYRDYAITKEYFELKRPDET